MKWLLVISLLGSAAFGDSAAAPVSAKAEHVQNIIYTTEGNRLIRRVIEPNGESFHFEECMFDQRVRANDEQPSGNCAAISPQFLNNAETVGMINRRFKKNLREDMVWARATRNISALVLPIGAVLSGRAAYLKWLLAAKQPALRIGVSTAAFTVLTYALATAAIDAWRTNIPQINADIERGSFGVENQLIRPDDPLNLYDSVKSALVRAVFDRSADHYFKIKCGLSCSAPKYSATAPAKNL